MSDAAAPERLDGHLTPLIRSVALGARAIASAITRVWRSISAMIGPFKE